MSDIPEPLILSEDNNLSLSGSETSRAASDLFFKMDLDRLWDWSADDEPSVNVNINEQVT